MGDFYNIFFPAVAVGASKVFWDVFVANTSGIYLRVHEVNPIADGSVAVVGALGIDVFLTRTSTIGTGGTAVTAEGTDPTAPSISCLNGSQPVPVGLTARAGPGGGATAGAVLNYATLFGEETNSAAYNYGVNMARMPGISDIPAIKIPNNSGFRLVQGAVAATGNVATNITIEVVRL